MTKKLNYLCILFLFLFSFSLNAQLFRFKPKTKYHRDENGKLVKDDQNSKDTAHKKFKFDQKNLRYGFGSAGLSFGNPTIISIAPLIGYEFNENLFVNFSAGYIYQRVNYGPITPGGANYIYENHIFYPSIGVSYGFGPSFVARAEVEFMNFKSDSVRLNISTNKYENIRVSAVNPYLGVGYRQPITERGYFYLFLLYNPLYTQYANENKGFWGSPFRISGFYTF